MFHRTVSILTMIDYNINDIDSSDNSHRRFISWQTSHLLTVLDIDVLHYDKVKLYYHSLHDLEDEHHHFQDGKLRPSHSCEPVLTSAVLGPNLPANPPLRPDHQRRLRRQRLSLVQLRQRL